MHAKIKDFKTIVIPCYGDERGAFHELFHLKRFEDITGNEFNFKQVNHSESKKGVLRGIHVAPFSKIVHCLKGRIFDVTVDLRVNSPTYLKWDYITLTPGWQTHIPACCGHAFYTLEASTIVYAQDGVYDKSREIEIRWNDPELNILWPHFNAPPLLSEKDANCSYLRSALWKMEEINRSWRTDGK